MHVFLTGPVQIGKSTLLRASLDALQPQKLGGFRTVSAQPQADGSRPVDAEAKQPRQGNAQRKGHEEVHADAVQKPRHIGAEHVQRAVGEVRQFENAEDHRKANCHERVGTSDRNAVDELL